MSIAMMTAVWEHSKQESGALLLMLAIADHANDSGVAFPSIERLAHKARLTERQIYRLVQQLIKSGEITVEHGGGRHRSNLYRINLAAFDMGVTEKQLPEPRPKKVSRGKAGKRNPKTSWPDGFELSPADRQFATQRGIDADLQFQLFHHKSLSEGWTSIDWNHKWREWVLHEVKYAAERDKRNGASRPAPPLTARQVAEQTDARARNES